MKNHIGGENADHAGYVAGGRAASGLLLDAGTKPSSVCTDPETPLRKAISPLAIIGPGVLVAATGVGAGDLATATFTGAKLGTAVLWAVIVGAALKFLLNEGLTRWQLATGTTLLEGCVAHFGRWVQWAFVAYLVVWSFLVAMALMSACGVAAQAMAPFLDDPVTGKIVYGILHSLTAVGLVLLGGYKLFEKVMGVCIGVMFLVIVITAVALHPPWDAIIKGAFVPTIPDLFGEGLAWTVALLGGVGGTVTVLCYGYWIREEGRADASALNVCRIDLAVGYTMTAVFGASMIVIGDRLGELDGRGAGLIVSVARTLETSFGRLGGAARIAFLIGAWGAFFSSLLGVWQSVPYLFADLWGMMGSAPQPAARPAVKTSSLAYRGYLAGIAVLPIAGLILFDFQSAIKTYSVIGAFFIPMLAAALLLLNGNAEWVGAANRNSKLTSALLLVTLLLFVIAGGFGILGALQR